MTRYNLPKMEIGQNLIFEQKYIMRKKEKKQVLLINRKLESLSLYIFNLTFNGSFFVKYIAFGTKQGKYKFQPLVFIPVIRSFHVVYIIRFIRICVNILYSSH